MNVDAVVVCGTSAADPLARVGGVPLLVRAVESILGAGGFGRVHVLPAHPDDCARVDAVCAGLPVVVHPRAVQRATGTGSDGMDTLRLDACAAEVLVVHDVAWALVACAEVLPRVLAGVAAGHAAVVPVVPLTDTVKVVDASGLVVGTPDRAGLRVVQTPQAYRTAAFDRSGLPSMALAAGAACAHTVAGDPSAFPLRTADDVELARAVVRR
ncbi:MAG: 2-C-methyl-D-erythritol 4-phosphate cytidylyltransferase [Pseudonocardia sp.]|nr:2-C-methyl-D-erythritol 4-phosphate cytidylyltransferase [Pseudonocardia sp.]